jgi:FtsH-binding integral membrane protein
MHSTYKLLQLALAVFGVIMLLLYPLALVWPAGFLWHHGAPYESDYFMMIVGVYATLGVFLINAARNPAANLSLIWFAVWSSVVHGAIMAMQSFRGDNMGHLWGDVLALFLVAIVLSVLVVSSGLKRSSDETGTSAQRSGAEPGRRG